MFAAVVVDIDVRMLMTLPAGGVLTWPRPFSVDGAVVGSGFAALGTTAQRWVLLMTADWMTQSGYHFMPRSGSGRMPPGGLKFGSLIQKPRTPLLVAPLMTTTACQPMKVWSR